MCHVGFLNKLLRFTPFHSVYKAFQKKRIDLANEKMEAKMLPLRIAFFGQFIRPGDLVFDIGANEGNRVKPFLACNAKVVAVEPQPNCTAILKAKFGDAIYLENVGLNDKAGELEMLISSDTTVSSFSSDFVEKTSKRFSYSKWDKKICARYHIRFVDS